ncbi:superoxide dismutase family protein [Paenibacillus ginsengarvi]|uniref:Superoxide dismutase [Cu-Zn] n=1 Tax=Paenibacillus ginsengarvi TaxID=400777 RepID=A0A3B0CBR3_9BACL|nr:superoxide dismutase family protein [Paenibacillus ginsengarvi]RKN80446.1 superoxide dismutase family protein [Paenibacillus ginsengarvi]
MNGKHTGLISLGVLLLAATGCQSQSVSGQAAAEPAKAVIQSSIVNGTGQTIGKATLMEQPGGVRIQMEVKGISPGVHGFHIHEVGKCEGPDFTSAGAHFNPLDKKHGLLSMAGPHAGDMPNLVAAADGSANADWLLSGVTLAPGKPNSLLKEGGTSLMIHEKADDGMTDPSGNSGARIACGVIRR